MRDRREHDARLGGAAGRLVARGDVPAQARVAVGQAREAVGDLDQLVDPPVLAQLREQVRDGGVVGAERRRLLPVVDRGRCRRRARRPGRRPRAARPSPSARPPAPSCAPAPRRCRRRRRRAPGWHRRRSGRATARDGRRRAPRRRGRARAARAARCVWPSADVGAWTRCASSRSSAASRRPEPGLDDAGQQQRVGAHRIGRERQLDGGVRQVVVLALEQQPADADQVRRVVGVLRQIEPHALDERLRSRCTAPGRRALDLDELALLEEPHDLCLARAPSPPTRVVVVAGARGRRCDRGRGSSRGEHYAPATADVPLDLAPPLEVHEVRERLHDGDPAGVRTEPIAVDAERHGVGVGGPVGQHRAVRAQPLGVVLADLGGPAGDVGDRRRSAPDTRPRRRGGRAARATRAGRRAGRVARRDARRRTARSGRGSRRPPAAAAVRVPSSAIWPSAWPGTRDHAPRLAGADQHVAVVDQPRRRRRVHVRDQRRPRPRTPSRAPPRDSRAPRDGAASRRPRRGRASAAPGSRRWATSAPRRRSARPGRGSPRCGRCGSGRSTIRATGPPSCCSAVVHAAADLRRAEPGVEQRPARTVPSSA